MDPSGIATLTGRRRVPCTLTIGRKGPNGAPIEKDRFHILTGDPEDRDFQKRDGGTYKAPMRDGHPEYEAFNKAGASYRRSIPIRLQHLTVPEMWEHRYGCASGAKGIPLHPAKAQVCKGNGVIADRWNGDGWSRIVCPGELCEYRQSQGLDYQQKPTKPPCGPWMRLIARFDWTRDGKQLPNRPFKFTSGGWGTTSEFKGFFDEFERLCLGLGVNPLDVPIFGMPVRLTLVEKTNPKLKSRYSVVSPTMDGDDDLVSWIGKQLSRRQEFRGLAMAAPLPALTDREQQEPMIIAADYENISPGLSVPAGK
jgi:hypothetical protein